jgi:hypothetical protein
VSISNEVGVRVRSPFDEHDRLLIRIGEKAIVVIAKHAVTGRYVDGANLTPIGRELVSVLPLPSDSNLKEVALGFKEKDFVEKVEIGDISNIDGDLRVLSFHACATFPRRAGYLAIWAAHKRTGNLVPGKDIIESRVTRKEPA